MKPYNPPPEMWARPVPVLEPTPVLKREVPRNVARFNDGLRDSLEEWVFIIVGILVLTWLGHL